MKAHVSILLLALGLLQISCGSNHQNDFDMMDPEMISYMEEMETYPEDHQDQGRSEHLTSRIANAGNGTHPMANQNNTFKSRNMNNDQVRMVPVRNPQTGQVGEYVPLPASWDVDENGIWRGPQGQKVTGIMGGNWSTAQENTSTIDQVIERKVKTNILPGYQLEATTEVNPAVAENCQRMMSNFWSYAPTQHRSYARSLRYVHTSTGNYSNLIVLFTHSTSQLGNFAGYMIYQLECGPAVFQSSLQTTYRALAGIKQDRQFLALTNQKMQQRSAASDRAFQSRMRARRATSPSYASSQSRLNDIYNDISDMSHNGYMERSNRSHAGTQSLVDGIHERNTIVNPMSGNDVHLSIHQQRHFTNQWDQVISTDDQFYNPNSDPAFYQSEWRAHDPNY